MAVLCGKKSFYEARTQILQLIESVETKRISPENAVGHILGEDLAATENIPPFDCTAYDGYALREDDILKVSRKNPVSLKILEEIPAGGIYHAEITRGYAAKVFTGSPVPPGADTVIPYEETQFTGETVTIDKYVKCGSNLIKRGEKIRSGTVIGKKGTPIGAGLISTISSQNIEEFFVYRIPQIGIISVGSELLPLGKKLEIGKIYNSNQYLMRMLVQQTGCKAAILGIAGDREEEICELIRKGLKFCDMILLTGGVSVGDYDLTPKAMEKAGIEILYRGEDLKSGMACACGVRNGKLICGLSGNPVSAISNFYILLLPAIKKMRGYENVLPDEIDLKLLDDVKKKSNTVKFLYGKLEINDGIVGIHPLDINKNMNVSAFDFCDAVAMIPAEEKSQKAGSMLKGFLLQ